MVAGSNICFFVGYEGDKPSLHITDHSSSPANISQRQNCTEGDGRWC